MRQRSTLAVLDDALILTIERAYFSLTGGFERWLYRIVRKHGGRQRSGWRSEFGHLYLKSGGLSPFRRFAFELRDIVRRQPLPGYVLSIEVEFNGSMRLAFEQVACGKPVDGLVLSGTGSIVPSGTGVLCYQEPKLGLTLRDQTGNRTRNLDSNAESNHCRARGLVENRAENCASGNTEMRDDLRCSLTLDRRKVDFPGSFTMTRSRSARARSAPARRRVTTSRC
jgi:plasmid replication initiation protein